MNSDSGALSSWKLPARNKEYQAWVLPHRLSSVTSWGWGRGSFASHNILSGQYNETIELSGHEYQLWNPTDLDLNPGFTVYSLYE